MTIKKIIELVDRQKPNQYDEADKIHWLSQMDYMVFREVISTHEGGAESFDGYTAADAEKQVLGGYIELARSDKKKAESMAKRLIDLGLSESLIDTWNDAAKEEEE